MPYHISLFKYQEQVLRHGVNNPYPSLKLLCVNVVSLGLHQIVFKQNM